MVVRSASTVVSACCFSPSIWFARLESMDLDSARCQTRDLALQSCSLLPGGQSGHHSFAQPNLHPEDVDHGFPPHFFDFVKVDPTLMKPPLNVSSECCATHPWYFWSMTQQPIADTWVAARSPCLKVIESPIAPITHVFSNHSPDGKSRTLFRPFRFDAWNEILHRHNQDCGP